jgi:hypothetical protein
MSIRRCQTHRYKGLPRIDLDKVGEIKNYFVYFIGSDDKVKPEKPFSLYTPNRRKTLVVRSASIIVQFYVTALLTRVCPSWNEPIRFDTIPLDSFGSCNYCG